VATSRLEQVLAEVKAAVLERIEGVAFGFGARHIESQEGAPPRVVWVRATDAYEPADGGAQIETVATRGTVVVAHCWGEAKADLEWDTDDAGTEALVDAVVAALHQVLGASGLPAAGEWLDTGDVSRGSVCLLSFTVSQPVAPRVLG
jgi:hypothetical protein